MSAGPRGWRFRSGERGRSAGSQLCPRCCRGGSVPCAEPLAVPGLPSAAPQLPMAAWEPAPAAQSSIHSGTNNSPGLACVNQQRCCRGGGLLTHPPCTEGKVPAQQTTCLPWKAADTDEGKLLPPGCSQGLPEAQGTTDGYCV